MTYPKMILFDYGHTLLYELGFDTLRAEKELFQYVSKNPYHVTAQEVNEFAQKIFAEIGAARTNGLELHERQFQRFVYEYLGIEFSISYEEAERVFWNAVSPGAVMPDADKMLAYINTHTIHSGVISNLGWSGQALTDRINRLLPTNTFEFVIASSEYMFRKPSRYLFELALRKAELDAKDVWFCGDNPQADVEGSAQVGIFPVWYDNDTERNYKDRSNETAPQCEHLHIHEWDEMIKKLEELK